MVVDVEQHCGELVWAMCFNNALHTHQSSSSRNICLYISIVYYPKETHAMLPHAPTHTHTLGTAYRIYIVRCVSVCLCSGANASLQCFCLWWIWIVARGFVDAERRIHIGRVAHGAPHIFMAPEW